MSKLTGRLLKIYVGNAAVDCLVDASMELNRETIDVSCKDNDTGYGGSIAGIATGSLSGSGYVVDDGTNNHTQIFDAFNDAVEIDWKLSAETAGTSFFSGKGFMTSFSMNAGISDAVQFSFGIAISGEVTKGGI